MQNIDSYNAKHCIRFRSTLSGSDATLREGVTPRFLATLRHVALGGNNTWRCELTVRAVLNPYIEFS